MSEYLKQEDLEVLMQLHHFRTTGEAGPEPSRHAVTRLEAERLVEPDEYGGIRLTERGMKHAREVIRAGEWKPDKSRSRRSERWL